MSPRTLQDPRAVMPLLASAALVVAALAAYHHGLSGAFNFDDIGSITDNPTIRHLWPPGPVLWPPARVPTGGRPVINLSFAVNYALGGMNVWGYHVVNLLVHILAGLTLFGIMRRTLARWSGLSPTRSFGWADKRVGDNPLHLILAFFVALIWTLHPLQTEAVTYVSERAESLMGLFYLLTLYGFIRYADESESEKRKAESGNAEPDQRSKFSPSAFRFPLFSIAACFLGMATKEVMVSAPVIVLLYDRTFVSGTFAEAWRRRRGYYLGLAGSWLLLIFLLKGVGARGVGFDQGAAWWIYALTECRVVLRYLGLAVWPHPLIFDYGSACDRPTWAAAPDVAVGLLLLAATLWLLFRPARRQEVGVVGGDAGTRPAGRDGAQRALGFAGAWFFLILAPTSSIVPVAGAPMAEHRMYLPLAAVVAVAVGGGWRLLARFRLRPAALGCAGLAVLAIAVVCGWLTARRNEDYRTAVSLWTRTAAACPLNPRAQYNLGIALGDAGDAPGAMEHYRDALKIRPAYPDALNNLGIALADSGRWPEAIADYESAIQLAPGFAKPYYNLGNAWSHLGRTAEAVAAEATAVRLEPDNPDFNYNLGNALRRLGRLAEAGARYEQALRLEPDFPKARNNLGNVRRELGDLPGAVLEYQQALRLKPDYVEARLNLAEAWAAQGRTAEAIAQYEAALRLQPENVEALDNLGTALAQSGLVDRAEEEFAAAARLEPGNPHIHFNLGCALAQLGRNAEARAQFEATLRLAPDDADARANLARLPNF